MPRREAMAERMADAVVRRLLVKKLVETEDEAAARGAVRKVLMDNLQAAERRGARGRVVPTLTDEAKLEESIDQEVPRTLSSSSRPGPKGCPQWEVLHNKTRDEVF